MDIKSGTFDKALAIKHLDCELTLLTTRVLALESGAPSANMDAAGRGATLYLGSEFNEKLHLALRAAGYRTKGHLRTASDQELLAVGGVGPTTLGRIRSALK